MKTAKFFHQQMDTGWTPFCVECQNPYVCPPLWRGMPAMQTASQARHGMHHSALLTFSGPAAGVNIVVGYKQNWIDIINSALNET